MASASSSAFEISDRYIIRLRKMSESGSRNSLHKLLKWVNPNWKTPVSFKEYLKSEKKVSMKALNSILKPHQRKILKKDPLGDTYDISLLYVLIQWGNEDLADKDDNVWQQKSKELEYLITAVKNVRNELMHSYAPVGAQEFLQMTENLRTLLKDLFSAAGSRYNHISPTDVDVCIQDIDVLINKIRNDPLDPQDFADYKQQLLFSQQCEYVKIDGALALQERHKRYSSLTPVSRLVKTNFSVGNVYTDVIARKISDQDVNIDLKDLLETNGMLDEDLIFIVGDAGIGKTTLTKKILSDWVGRKSNIQHINAFDLVIHAECRDHIESFKHLLNCSMPKISETFQGDDLVFVTVSLKTLLIIDGLDELNQKSTKLFKEILKLKKDHNVTVIVTSRPEAIERGFHLARSYQIEIKHIELLGIPPEKREEFVIKYFDSIDKTGLSNSSIEGLLKYLKRTAMRLGYLWRSPYNLSVLTILWVLKPDVINSIATAPELHWEIHQLTLSKLKERLFSNDFTQHFSPLQTEKMIHNFLYKLCREALVALVDDDVTLPQEAYQRLVDTCHEMEIPAEEMLGAFLKKISTDSGIRYSFPHKGLQDFLAALFIWMRITAPLHSWDIQKIIREFNDVFAKNNISYHCSQNILRFVEKELLQEVSRKSTANTKPLQNLSQQGETQSSQETSHRTVTSQSEVDRITEQFMKIDNVPEKLGQTVCKVIKEGFENDPKSITQLEINAATRDTEIAKIITSEASKFGLLPELSKFQNMLVSLLGIFYMNPNSNVGDKITEEVLQLLQQSGVRGKDAWLKILNSVRCNTYVAMFISKIPEIMEGNIVIDDSTLFAYISLMQALKPSLKDRETQNLVIDVKGDLTGAENLFNLISYHQYNVKSIFMNDENFSEYNIILESLSVPLKDSHGVNVNISVSKHLLELKDLMTQIKRNNFSLSKLQVGSCEIKDNQTMEFISLLKGLPQHSDVECQIPVSLKIQGGLTDADELLELISFHHFQLDRVLVHDENILQYTQLLEALKSPLINPNDVNFSVYITKSELASGLLNEIEKNSYSLETFHIYNFQINDINLSDCINMIRSFPVRKCTDNTTSAEICVKGNLGGTSLLQDLRNNMFTVSKILVTSCNLSEYTSMLKLMPDHLRIGVTSFHINLDEDLNTVRELIHEIKDNKCNIGKLKLRKIRVTDSNAHEILSVLSSFPETLAEANETSIDLDVSGSLNNADDLMNVITSRNFLLETIIVTENNYKDYTPLFQSFTTKMLDDVKLKVHISKDIFNIQNFMDEVTKRNIRLSSFSIKTPCISDTNFKKFTPILESLPPTLKDVNESEVEVSISKDLTGCEKVVELLSNHHFQIQELLITDGNVKKYSEIMKALAVPLKTCPGGGITIKIENDISNLYELLSIVNDHLPVKRISVYQRNYIDYINLFETQGINVNCDSTVDIDLNIDLHSPSIINLIDFIKRKQFHIRYLSLSKSGINDNNACDYITVLRSLPTLENQVFGTLKVDINSNTSKIEELFAEIGRNGFQVEIKAQQDFRNPTSQLSWRDDFNSLQKSQISLLTYQGAFVGGMISQQPVSHLIRLLGSVADTDGYDVALDFMLDARVLNDIQLCISNVVPASHPNLQPIPPLRDNAEPTVFITDVVDNTIKNASALIKKLQPKSKNKKYDVLGFPRATLTMAGMKELLSTMGTVMSNNLVFPTSCKPNSSDDEKLLQGIAQNIFKIKISWGKVMFRPINLDNW